MKRFAIALSLANLCLLASWREIISPSLNGYHLETNATAVEALALFLDVLLLAAVMGAASLLHRRAGILGQLVRIGFLGLFVIALNNVLVESLGGISIARLAPVFGRSFAVGIIASASIAGFYSIIRWNRPITAFARIFLLIAFPLVILNLYYVAAFVLQSNLIFPNTTALAAANVDGPDATRNKQRIVWIVFDELDYRVTFPDRPTDVKLPELDRFANESLFATNAYSPAGVTLLSMPALTTGRLVAEAHQSSFDQLSIRFADTEEFVDWKTQPTIFSELHNRGASLGVVGWYHPYCRMFGGLLTRCSGRASLSGGPVPPTYPLSVFSDMGAGFLRLAQSVPVVRDVLLKDKDYQEKWNRSFIAGEEHLTERSLELVGDPQYSFVFLHLPAAHEPYLFDRKTGAFDERAQHDYFDNLIYLDRLFGKIRQSMESSGTWDKSVVIVTSDHWWRAPLWNKQGIWPEDEAKLSNAKIDYKVPFLLKTARDKDNNVQELTYGSMFNNVLTHDLVLAIVDGRISTKEEIASWLESHRSVGHTEYGLATGD